MINEVAMRLTQLIADPGIPNFILLYYIAECGLGGSNGQAHNLKM